MIRHRGGSGHPRATSAHSADECRRVRRIAIAAKLNCAVLADMFDLDTASRDLLARITPSPKVSHLVRPLVDLGFSLHLVTLSEHVSSPLTVTGAGVDLTICPLRTSQRGRDFFAFERRQIRDALHSRPVDVVHAHHTYEYALGALATGLPTLISVRDWAPYQLRVQPDAFRLVKVGVQMAVLLRGDHFTVNSPYLQQRLGRIVRGHPPVVPNCLPPEVLTIAPRTPTRSEPTVVAVNRGFSRRKNITSLLEAFPHVRASLRDAQLVLAGPGYGPGGPAVAWARAQGLDEGVSFVGQLPHDQVLALLDTADLLAHPALEESFGIVLIEAMARGTPVVAGANSGAVRWVLAEGEAGALTDVDDPVAIAETIVTHLTAPDRWRTLSEVGREHVRRHFTAPAVTASYAREYENVLAASGERR